MILPSGGHGHAIGRFGPRRWAVHREVARLSDGRAVGVANGEHHPPDGQGIGEVAFIPTDPAMGQELGAPLALPTC